METTDTIYGNYRYCSNNLDNIDTESEKIIPGYEISREHRLLVSQRHFPRCRCLGYTPVAATQCLGDMVRPFNASETLAARVLIKKKDIIPQYET